MNKGLKKENLRSPGNKTVSILVINGGEDQADRLRRIFENAGFSVFTSPDPDDALHTLESFRIDIILLGFAEGESDGLETGRSILSRFPGMKIILQTPTPSIDMAVKATKWGFFDFIDTGVPAEKLVGKVREAAEEISEERMKAACRNNGTCLKFITFCRHSLIVDQIRNITGHSLCFDFSGNFKTMKDLRLSGYHKETDLAIVCASCLFASVEDAFRFMKEIYRLFPFIRIVVMNDGFQGRDKAQLLRMGVKGFFKSEMNGAEIEKALLIIRDGGIWADREILNMAIEPDIANISRFLSKYENPYELSRRETEILRTMILGIRNVDIAERLFISEKTVKTHINRIFKKLGVDSRVRAILKAKEENLV